MKKFESHITIEKITSIIEALQTQCDLSINEIKKAIDKGALWHERGNTTQRCRRLKKPLHINDKLHFYYNGAILSQTPEPAILHADLGDYSVWYKPYGMLSQGSKWSDHCTISRWAQKNLLPERPVFPVHRLDRAATGLILIAHNKKAAQALSKMFELHQLDKIYHIIVHGNHQSRPQPETITLAIDGKPACSHFTYIDYDKTNDLSLVKVNIESGRKHQIRIHAASIGYPVLGDRLHGKQPNADSTTCGAKNNLLTTQQVNLQLCAVELKFHCPINNHEQHFTLPNEMRPQFDKCVTPINEN